MWTDKYLKVNHRNVNLCLSLFPWEKTHLCHSFQIDYFNGVWWTQPKILILVEAATMSVHLCKFCFETQ